MPCSAHLGQPPPIGLTSQITDNNRALNSYLIGPGSIVDDKPYVVERDAPIAMLPAWLTGLLRSASRGSRVWRIHA
ncbi:hypothetical protein Ppa06_70000 [Planomonospora parontospora subsp. parontospora]|uniref:Uncharacterized protein n=2 Tax=Planomonospora parontospora TaxID=58119 RepID=A0AA37BMU7_9ACTN|nr:hypothetical protein [Planomonospora parontospora]GGK94049.1 hypothetical protein GCM10010126_61780 [Planomonospora parontospora]GII13202.1 hypothetical protein Ppa06_70000 [Planomonospora parontospora subsp. parontospora]